MSIVTGDEKALTAAQGIGKKIAQRIILELKDKMAKETAAGLDFSGGKGVSAPAMFSSKAAEAAAALGVLGYSGQEVRFSGRLFRLYDDEKPDFEGAQNRRGQTGAD